MRFSPTYAFPKFIVQLYDAFMSSCTAGSSFWKTRRVTHFSINPFVYYYMSNWGNWLGNQNMSSNETEQIRETIEYMNNDESTDVHPSLSIEPTSSYLLFPKFSPLPSESSFPINSTSRPSLMNNNNNNNDNNFSDSDDAASFVVLDDDETDAVQASLLASYVDIERKSMLIDYNSVISSLSESEILSKLKELMQENVKLKDILKDNNSSMRQQFETITIWKDNALKLRENYINKLAETNELIADLSIQNAVLKVTKAFPDSETSSNNLNEVEVFHTEMQTQESHCKLQTIENPKYVETCSEKDQEIASLKEKLPTLEQHQPAEAFPDSETNKDKMGIFDKETVQHSTVRPVTLNFEILPEKKIQLEMEKQSELQVKSESTDENKTSETLRTAKNPEHLDIYFYISMCAAKDQEIASLKKKIITLEQQLQTVFTPIEVCNLSKLKPTVNHKILMENVKQYNDISQELTECFATETTIASVDKNFKNILKVVELLTTLDTTHNNTNTPFEQLIKELRDYCKQFTKEKWNIIANMQVQVKLRNLFLKIASDYHRLTDDLKIVLDKNATLNMLKNNTTLLKNDMHEQSHFLKKKENLLEHMEQDLKMMQINLKETIDHWANENRIVQNREKDMNIQTDRLLREWNLLKQERTDLKQESIDLKQERTDLKQERADLKQERKSLDQQFAANENLKKKWERDLNEYKIKYKEMVDKLEKKHEDFNEYKYKYKEIVNKNAKLEKTYKDECKKSCALQEKYDNINKTNSGLLSQNKEMSKSYQREKKLRDLLLEQKNILDTELQKQIVYSRKLRKLLQMNQIDTSNIPEPIKASVPESDTESVTTCNDLNDTSSALRASLPPCPKCAMTFLTSSALRAHIEACINLQ